MWRMYRNDRKSPTRMGKVQHMVFRLADLQLEKTDEVINKRDKSRKILKICFWRRSNLICLREMDIIMNHCCCALSTSQISRVIVTAGNP